MSRFELFGFDGQIVTEYYGSTAATTAAATTAATTATTTADTTADTTTATTNITHATRARRYKCCSCGMS